MSWICFPQPNKAEAPETLKHEIYDEAGERIIEDLPPGLYWQLRRISHVVRIDDGGRARQYPFEKDGSRCAWEPYRGPATDLRRVCEEPRVYEFLGWPVPAGARQFGYDEALNLTPWASRSLQRYGGWTAMTSYLPVSQHRAIELILRCAPVSEDARRLAEEVLRQVEAPRRLVELLASEYVEHGEQEMLLGVADGLEGEARERSWAGLVFGLLSARRARGRTEGNEEGKRATPWTHEIFGVRS